MPSDTLFVFQQMKLTTNDASYGFRGKPRPIPRSLPVYCIPELRVWRRHVRNKGDSIRDPVVLRIRR